MAGSYSPILSPAGEKPGRNSFAQAISQTLPDLRPYIPHRVRRKWRATKNKVRSGRSSSRGPQSNGSVTKLNTSFSPADTIRALREHKWSYYDAQYLLLLLIAVFVISINEASPVIKTAGALGLSVVLILPITRQFFLPCLPIFGWLILFFSCK